MLPVLTIGFGGIALVARVTRVALVEVGREDFVTLLHAKGLSRSTICFEHLMPHALLPVVTILALRIGWILGGAVTVEFVFGRPGLGSLADPGTWPARLSGSAGMPAHAGRRGDARNAHWRCRPGCNGSPRPRGNVQ